MSQPTPASFIPTSLARVNKAARIAAYMLWMVTTIHGDRYTVIALDAHDARHQVNEMLQRIGSSDRAQVVTHSHVLKEQHVWRKIKSIPLPCSCQAAIGLRGSLFSPEQR